MNIYANEVVDLVKSFRAYYLIFNEFPPDAGWDEVPNKLRPFVPHHLIDSSQRKWNRRPLGNTAYLYDLENWVNKSQYKTNSSGVSLYGLKSTDLEKCYRKFRSIMEERYVIKDNGNGGMICTLPECPGATVPSSTTPWENRYY
jgi:hypothetical protein